MKIQTLVNKVMSQSWKLSFVIYSACLFVLIASNTGKANDWPTYRCGITRSGVTNETVGPELFLQWKYTSLHRPKPAWPIPAEEMPRAHSDNAFNAVVADGGAYFGSSVDDKVYSIDIASGEIRWMFFTEGPVRFAPAWDKGRVYFGSDDGYVYCLNARDGKVLWKYRPGPSDEKVIGNGRMISLWPVRTSVLVDDGAVYCGAGVFPYEGIYICALNADDGSVLWQNDTIGDRAHELDFGGISPQGYLLASKDILYVPAGRAMPAAFDRKTGEFLYYAKPSGKRGGTWALLDEDRLISGVDFSGTPHKLAFDAKTGKNKGDAFIWFHGIDMAVTHATAYILTQDNIYALDRATHTAALKNARGAMKKRQELKGKIEELREESEEANANEAKELNKQITQAVREESAQAKIEKGFRDSSFKWHFPAKGFSSVILAGDYLYAGGKDLVVGINAVTGKEVWKTDVSGNAVGLAAADGYLIASTDEGFVYCFGNKKLEHLKNIKVALNPSAYPEDKTVSLYESAVEKILKETPFDKGYCLVLDCNDGRLAYELAKRTNLQIIGLENNKEKLAAARKKLELAGLLGSRVTVEPWAISTLPEYFANLIVSDGMLTSGKTAASDEQIGRVLRPYGGTALLGGRDFSSGKISWKKNVRGELEGAGNWTHYYGNSENTACSEDQLVKGPVGVLWFGEPGPQRMVERHAKAQGPVSMNGRLFVQGGEVVMAYDAYNGTFLWQRQIPGAVRPRVDVDGGNLALTKDGLYIAAFDQCLRLDPATGETLRTFELSPSSDGNRRRWGFISCDGNILFGSTAVPLKSEYAQRYKAQFPLPDEKTWQLQRSGALWTGRKNSVYPRRENYNSAKNSVTDRMMVGDKIFAINVQTGKLLWQHQGSKIAHITVTIADGKIFFAENDITDHQKKTAIAERKQLIAKGIYENFGDEEVEYEDLDVRTVFALNAATGEKLWEKTVDLTWCCGDAMGSAYKNNVLLFFGCVGNHDAWRFQKGQLKYKRIVALSADSGDMLWSRPLGYRTRPLIVGEKIILEPHACDLYTGEIQMRQNPITGLQDQWEFLRPGHTCAITSASASTLFYRSACMALYDMAEDRGVTLFGGIRPGCWINMVPAGGLLLCPEASSGCTCSYPIRCSLALKHKSQRSQPWTVFVTPGDVKPVKHLAVNFGAPGDMKDDDGIVWFGYPNPKTQYLHNHFQNYGVKFDFNEKILKGMGYFCSDFRNTKIDGTKKPWLFTSGCQGLLRCELPLIDPKDQQSGVYTVRLGFKGAPADQNGRRIFDIKLQNVVAAKDFDIVRTAGNPDKAIVKEFKDICVKDNMLLELIPKSANPQSDQAPLINFVEIIRTNMN